MIPLLCEQNKLRYPYSYFGSDGVTAFDSVDTNMTGT